MNDKSLRNILINSTLAFIPAEASDYERRKYVYRLMFFPILIGNVVNTIFAFPVPASLSIVYPATSSFVIMSSFGAIVKSPMRPANGTVPGLGKQRSKSLMVLAGFCIAVNRLLVLGLG